MRNITGIQVKLARAVLSLSIKELSGAANVGVTTINRIEKDDPIVLERTKMRVVEYLEVKLREEGWYFLMGGIAKRCED